MIRLLDCAPLQQQPLAVLQAVNELPRTDLDTAAIVWPKPSTAVLKDCSLKGTALCAGLNLLEQQEPS